MDSKLLCLFAAICCLFCEAYNHKTLKLNPVVFKTCDSGKKAKLMGIKTDADSDKEVILVKGTNVTIYFEFTEEIKSPKAISVVHGKIGFLPAVAFNPPNPNGCLNSNLTCPLTSGKVYTYKAVIPVLEEYPSVRLLVYWELTPDGTASKDNDLWCAVMPAEIKSKS